MRFHSRSPRSACFTQPRRPWRRKRLTVWWSKGFYKSEDDALLEAIKKFEAKTGIKVELSQYAIQDMIPKTVAALDSGTVPDVAYSDTYDVQAQGKWAFEGKLEDLSDILVPMKSAFAPNTLETALLYNDDTKKKGYYGFPLKQQSMHVQIWRTCWSRPASSTATSRPNGKTTGRSGATRCSRPTARPPAPRSTASASRWAWNPPTRCSRSTPSWTPTTSSWSTMTASFWSTIPRCATGLIGALKDYTDPYIKGCTPPSSTTWKDPDNNVAFHNQTIVMTHNFTISIAAKWLDDYNNPALTPEQRAAGKKAYEETIITASFPNKPDGTPIKYRSDVKTGLIFASAKNKAEAKEFVKFLLQEENLGPTSKARSAAGSRRRSPARRARSGRPTSIARRSTPSSWAAPAVRLHQELQVHHPEQRERLGQGDEPGGEREGAGRQGRRRTDRPHQAGRG